MLKQGDKIQLDILGYGSNAEGVANYQDYVVFVSGALQGEKVVARITYVKRQIAYAVAVEIVSSNNRNAPVCKHFGKCGGCQMQHFERTEELKFKTELVRNNLKKLGGIDVGEIEIVHGKRFGYRNKLSLPVGGKTGNVTLGMYAEGTHEIVDIPNCCLGGSWMKSVVSCVKEYLDEAKVKPYCQSDFSGEIRHVVARFVDGQLLVMLVSNGEFGHDLKPLIELLKKCFDKFGLFVNVNTQKNNVILGKTTKHVYGIKYVESVENGVAFRLQPSSFFQVNDEIKTKLYERARSLVDSANAEVLIDCFSGVGLLTMSMAKDYETYAVEIVADAVADADAMKQRNNLAKLTNVCGDVNVELPKICDKFKGRRTVMLVDPPRKGLGEEVCQTVLKALPTKVVYVSCDSATLSRDVKMLLSAYDVESVSCWDMFPNTKQVETLVCLKRK